MSGEQTKPGVPYAEARAWLDGRADERIFAAYAVACAIAVRAELDRRGEEIERLKSKLEMRRSEAEDTLRALTPGGSEFQTPAECADFVRRDREHVKELHRSLAAARSERDRAQEERDELRAGLMIPGEQRCPECLFSLHKLQVRAEDGAIRHLTIMAIEDCPNGHGPLVGVTYEQGWREMVRAASTEAARAEVLNDKLASAERALAAANAKIESYEQAADPFVRAVRINEPLGLPDDTPAREVLPPAWIRLRELKALALLASPSPGPEPAQVAGETVLTSLAEFERKCCILISEEQTNGSPNTALIGVLCEAVRLKRELVSSLGASVQPPSPGPEPAQRSMTCEEAGCPTHAPAQPAARERYCKWCGAAASFLGPILMWQHCPKHESGALCHEWPEPKGEGA